MTGHPSRHQAPGIDEPRPRAVRATVREAGCREAVERYFFRPSMISLNLLDGRMTSEILSSLPLFTRSMR